MPVKTGKPKQTKSQHVTPTGTRAREARSAHGGGGMKGKKK